MTKKKEPRIIDVTMENLQFRINKWRDEERLANLLKVGKIAQDKKISNKE